MDNITISNDNTYPVNNLILIDPVVKPTETKLGLTIANNQEWESTPTMGEVLKIGGKVTLVKPGDKIMFRRYSADKVIINDAGEEKFIWLLEEESILGIIK